MADMREMTGDLFTLAEAGGSWLIVTTNGCLDKSGRLVMGAGVAGAARDRYEGLAAALGAHVAANGNVPGAVGEHRVLSWPTKPATHTVDGKTHLGWMCAARVRDPRCVREVARLVWHSAPKLVALADQLQLTGPIYAPRPGCGLGGLDWAQVKPALAGVLDDRFVIVSPPAT